MRPLPKPLDTNEIIQTTRTVAGVSTTSKLFPFKNGAAARLTRKRPAHLFPAARVPAVHVGERAVGDVALNAVSAPEALHAVEEGGHVVQRTLAVLVN